ncbi:hypothetical protein D3C84_1187270 [compost metagenome]
MHIAQTLAVNLRQHLAAAQRLASDLVELLGGHGLGRAVFTLLLSQGAGKKILPQVADATQCLGIVPAIVADGRDIT